jgi:hypothetical protein
MRPIRASESFLEFPTALLCPFPGTHAGHMDPAMCPARPAGVSETQGGQGEPEYVL